MSIVVFIMYCYSSLQYSLCELNKEFIIIISGSIAMGKQTYLWYCKLMTLKSVKGRH